jgi:hypothetical protein
MTSLESSSPKLTAGKAGLLLAIFFLIACGLGYPILNRFDPRETPGLSDVKVYAEMVSGKAGPEAEHVRFRVLVPWLAKPVYRIAVGRTGSWNPTLFALLFVDSSFVAATALLIVVLGKRCFGDSPVGLVAALLYLVDFAVPNLRLVGLIDAGEGFFLLALLECLTRSSMAGRSLTQSKPRPTPLWLLQWIAILGTMTKESFVPFSMAFTAVWWMVARREPDHDERRSSSAALWIMASWIAAVATFLVLHRAIAGSFISPIEFAQGLHHGHDYLAHIGRNLVDRQLWYIFVWLLPTAFPNLMRLPRAWRLATAGTCMVAFALDAYYGGVPGTIGRALFTIAGPLLSLSSAMLLLKLL